MINSTVTGHCAVKIVVCVGISSHNDKSATDDWNDELQILSSY